MAAARLLPAGDTPLSGDPRSAASGLESWERSAASEFDCALSMRGGVCGGPEAGQRRTELCMNRKTSDEQSRLAVRRGNTENTPVRGAQIMVLPSTGCRAADGDRAHGRTGTGRSDAALLHSARFGFSFFHDAWDLRCARI